MGFCVVAVCFGGVRERVGVFWDLRGVFLWFGIEKVVLLFTKWHKRVFFKEATAYLRNIYLLRSM